MLIKKVKFTGFRNLLLQSFEPSSGINLFTGRNAQGKSNMLEGISLISSGRSFRTSRETEMIGNDAAAAFLEGVLEENGVESRVKIILNRDKVRKKQIIADGKPVKKFSEFLQRTGCVVFSRADISLVSGSPEIRRNFIDRLLCISDEKYLTALQSYYTVLRQKNAALKSGKCGLSLLDVFNEQLSRFGAEIVIKRRNSIEELSKNAFSLFSSLFDGTPNLGIVYKSVCSASIADLEGIKNSLLGVFKSKIQYECDLRMASVGPHRDDILIAINSLPAKTFASQGQQRACAVALKLAESIMIGQAKKIRPIIFMDDCFSEMDEYLKASLWEYLADQGQVFLTSNAVPPENNFLCVEISEGRIEKIVYKT